MNISKFSALCLLAAASAFAQLPWETGSASESSGSSEETSVSNSSENATSSYAPARRSSSPAAEKESAASEGKNIFDTLRGHAYNPGNTVGAATSVSDLLEIPSDINGRKFFYVSPTDRIGYTAFGLGGGTAMLGLDNSPFGTPAALILGYATPGFGIALNYSVAKNWRSRSEQDIDQSGRYTDPGDNIGLYFSLPIGFATLYANASWLTYDDSYSQDVNGDETKRDYSTIEANVGLTNNSNSLSYDGYLNVIRTGGTGVNPDDSEYVEEDAYLGFALNFELGYAALQSSTARVIIGANNRLLIRLYDEIKEDELKSDNIIIFHISPNILAEVSLFENWLAFAGATHAINLTAGDGDRDDDTSSLDIRHTPAGTYAFAGIRYQKTNWAVEAQISANMFNNPFGGFNGSNMFAGFGGFIYF